jgi:hypothetical protein
MRKVMFIALALAAGLGARRAHATPFEPGTVPDQVQAVGHLDVDALRKTQLFDALGGQAAIEAGLENAPPEVRSVARTLVRGARGVTFWRGAEHGAIYVETRDSHSLAQLLAKLPGKPGRPIDGFPTYALDEHGQTHFAAAYADTLVLADSDESLAQSIHVLAGKAASLAGTTRLTLASRQGLFVFVTIGDGLMNSIQKSAHSKMLQLAVKSVVVDGSEQSGVLVATAHAEMRTADAAQKARSILDGLQAMASLSDDAGLRTLLDGVTVTSSGMAVDVVAKVPVAQVAKLAREAHGGH